MKLHAEISGQQHDIEVQRDTHHLIAVVDDRSYECEVSEPEPGLFLIKHEGSIFEARVTRETESADHVIVNIDGRFLQVRLTDPKQLRSSAGSDSHGDGIASIRTAMPGAGTEVEKGQGVVVVEAMKMQNELKAPKAGIVKNLRVSEGDTVAAGDVLAVVE
jgi:biotin carboxyl carrier protein